MGWEALVKSASLLFYEKFNRASKADSSKLKEKELGGWKARKLGGDGGMRQIIAPRWNPTFGGFAKSEIPRGTQGSRLKEERLGSEEAGKSGRLVVGRQFTKSLILDVR